MKKILSLIITLVMGLTFLTGCSDPVYDEFENFLNVQMVDVNANYEKIKAEAATWAEFEDPALFVTSIDNTLLPVINDSLEKLSAINTETEEVKDLKAKYVKVMDAYKAGFETVRAAVEANDVDQMNAGNEKINEGISLLEEYNAALEALAEQVGATIEY
ncbi:MAG: hypothetical protein IJD30_01035 [Clostridia bacterium]|nr:hypothetical protein [Clostridia bacterium]